MKVNLLKPMLPTLVHEIPEGDRWLYEIKYDGYRTILHWDNQNILLQSRNLNSLNDQFPEVVQGITQFQDNLKDLFPLILDGELCILASRNKANFSAIQERGRLRSTIKISSASNNRPAKLVIFDILQVKNETLTTTPFHKRKEILLDILYKAKLPTEVEPLSDSPILGVNHYSNKDKIWELVIASDSEGIIAKRKESIWKNGRTKDWLKIKNNKHGLFIITGYDTLNSFFHVGVYRNNSLFQIGVFSHGLEGNERNAMVEIMIKNKLSESKGFIAVEPKICVELEYLELYKEQLRQARFLQFRFDRSWEDCTWEALQINKVN
jgi:bifunctional non-homologous end joining protein LigD